MVQQGNEDAAQACEDQAQAPAAHETQQAAFRLVREAGERPLRSVELVLPALAVLACVACFGFVAGAFVWLCASAIGLGVQFVWFDAWQACGNAWWYPLAVCTLAGLSLGLVAKRFKTTPKQFGALANEIKTTGAYNIGNLGAATYSFLAPLIFGGSVGPAVGLTGVLATAISRFTAKVNALGVKLVCRAASRKAQNATKHTRASQNAQGEANADLREGSKTAATPQAYRYAKPMRLTMITCGVLAAVSALVACVFAFGWHMHITRFAVEALSWSNVGDAVLALAVAYVLAFFLGVATRSTTVLAGKIPHAPLVSPIVCGVLLGGMAIVFPLALCTGLNQTVELMASWTAYSAAALLLLALVKTVITPFCMSLGWGGGPFYPLIFAGLSCGYALSAYFGADPIICASVVAVVLLTGATKMPLIVVAFALLCFPLECLPFMLCAAVFARFIPLPKALKSV